MLMCGLILARFDRRERSPRRDDDRRREDRGREERGREDRGREERGREERGRERSPRGERAAPADGPVATEAAIATPVATALPVVAAAATPAATAPIASAPEAAAKAMPKVQAYALPLESLQSVAQDSGLQWVNSDPQRIAAVQAAIAAEVPAQRVPRERPAPVVMSDAPLILVETKKDLRNMTLPFEEAPAA